jgi:hypothetical protein
MRPRLRRCRMRCSNRTGGSNQTRRSCGARRGGGQRAGSRQTHSTRATVAWTTRGRRCQDWTASHAGASLRRNNCSCLASRLSRNARGEDRRGIQHPVGRRQARRPVLKHRGAARAAERRGNVWGRQPRYLRERGRKGAVGKRADRSPVGGRRRGFRRRGEPKRVLARRGVRPGAERRAVKAPIHFGVGPISALVRRVGPKRRRPRPGAQAKGGQGPDSFRGGPYL